MKSRVLVVISNPTVANGVVGVLRLDPRFDVQRVPPHEAIARCHEWNADLVLADAPAAVGLREIASKVLVTAAGDGAIARVTAAQIGAAGWFAIDDIDRQVAKFLDRGASRHARATRQSLARRALVFGVAILAVACLAISVLLLWRALVP